MSEFTTKIDRLMERLQRGITKCDHIEQRACIAEERLEKLDKSIRILARLIEVSFLLLISSDKEKLTWLQLTNETNLQFLNRLESYLKREIIDNDEKQAYVQALFLIQSPLIVSSGFF
jgi:hypothetical protein